MSFGSNLREKTTSISMRIYNMYSYVCVYMMYLWFLRFIYLPIYLFIYSFMCLFISTYIMCIGTLYKHITKPISHNITPPQVPSAHALQRRIARGKGQATRETCLARHGTEALRHELSPWRHGPGWSSTSCGPGCSSHQYLIQPLKNISSTISDTKIRLP